MASVPEMSQTVDHAARLLQVLRGAGVLPTTELARRLGVSRTVATRLVSTLAAHDLVCRTPGGVTLGFGLLDLAAGLAATVRRAAQPHLQELALRVGETAVLAIADGDTAVAVDQVVADHRVVRIDYRSGSRHSLADAAHGRAMLAHAADDRVVRLVSARPDGAAVERDLAAIRRTGYATSHDELETGVTGVAAPIFDSRGVVVASIGVVAPTPRLSNEPELGAAVVAAATRTTRALSASPATRAPV